MHAAYTELLQRSHLKKAAEIDMNYLTFTKMFCEDLFFTSSYARCLHTEAYNVRARLELTHT